MFPNGPEERQKVAAASHEESKQERERGHKQLTSAVEAFIELSTLPFNDI